MFFMLDKIINFSLHNRLLVLVCAVLLVIGGLYTTKHTEVDVFPDLNAPTVVVMTEANGMAAEEVEQLVTFPIETAVNGSTGVRRVRSASTTGFSVVWVEFDWGTDIYRDRQIVSEKLQTIAETLPKQVSKPMLGPQSSILGELLIVSLTSDSTSMLNLRTLADWHIRPRLLSIAGVAQVAVIGGDQKEYQIQLHPGKMSHYGVNLADVMAATRGMNKNMNGGVLYEYGNEYIIRGMMSGNTLERIGKSVVKKVNDNIITLSDIADIKIGAQTPKLGVASEKGKPAVLLTVTKQPNTGTIELTEKIDTAIAQLQNNLPKDVHISTDIFRQSRFIENAVNNVKVSLLEGALFVVIILFLFLANVRTTIISLVTIPLSLLVSILVLHYLGQSINTMSLGGLAIAIGSLVDDAIVDVENVCRKLRENHQLPLSKQQTVLSVVYHASREVRMPILNSTLIIIVSFVPLFFLSGMEGRMLIPLGIAFIVALFASTIVALTLTPVLCSYLLKGTKQTHDNSKMREPKLATWLKQKYTVALVAVLHRKRLVVSCAAGLLLLTIGLFFTLGHSFLPPFNEGSFTINVSTMPGVSLEESDKIGKQAEELLISIPEIKTVARKTGRAELDEHALGVNMSEIEAPFELNNRSQQAFIEDVRSKLATIVGANIEIGQPISHRIDAMLSGTKASIAIKVFGNDLNKMYNLGTQIKTTIADIQGLKDLNVEQQVERPELKITPKPEMLARYGITEPAFNNYIAVLLNGETVSQVYEGNQSFNLVVRSADNSRHTIDAIKNLLVDTPDGKKIPLSNIADVISSAGPNTINRENVSRKIVVSANTHGRDVGSVVKEIEQRISKQITLPKGYRIEYGGQFESEKAASRTLMLTSILSIVIIFLLLYMQFRNTIESGAILLNLPFALIGGVLVLWCTSGETSIPAIIGFISLFGIATRNGMLLITHYNHLCRDKGFALRESVLKGSADRLNPILMTALTSALALVPLVFRGNLPGNEIQSPMATVILGGLLTSTFLNAFIIPIVYEWIYSKTVKK